MKFGSKSTSGNGILLILTIFLLFFITLALASQNFEVSTDKESYYQNEDIYILISGPGNTEFAIKIINPNDLMISEKRGKTTSSGNSYLKYDGFSALGEYKVRLLVDNNVKAVTTFRIVNPIGVTTTTTTTKLPTTITVTTSLVFPTTPTTTVVTTGDVGGGLGEVDTSHPPPPDSFKEKRFSLRSAKYHFSAEESPEFELKIKNAGISTLTSLKPQAHIEDRSGNSVEIEPEIKKLWNGYKIEIPTQRSIQPGLYKLVVDCEGEKQELWFQWGLVSVNTRKSIYHPNETAEILMVVLDKDGHLVSNADIILKVTNPGGLINYYSTFDGSINELERGIYLTNHTATWEEGNYSLYVIATAEDVTSSIKSHFSVKGFYEFDILREIPVTIDPRKGPFESRIRVISYINVTSFILKEYLSVEFNVTDEGGANLTVKEDEIILTWNLTNNSVISYFAQAPLIWPYLYEIGPAGIEYNMGIFTEARPWMLAVDPAPSIESLWSESNSVSADLTLIGSGNADGSTTETWADANGKWAKEIMQWWEFVMQNSNKSGTINNVTLYLKHYQTGWVNDNFLIQIYNGSIWTDVRSYTAGDGPPGGDTTDNWDVNVLGIDTWTEINASRVRIIGNGQSAKEDTVDWFVDTVELRVNYTLPNQPPVVETPKTYNFTLAEKSTFEVGEIVRIMVNVTDANGASDINTVLIEILNTSGNCKACNDSITDNNITNIPNGYTYEYNYTILSDADNGTWTINIYANDTANIWDSNTTTFNVTLPPPVLSINLTSPLSDPGITESESFEMNCTANCTTSDCSNVNVYPIYCSGSLTCTPNLWLNTTSTGLYSNYDNISLGTVNTTAEKVASFNITGLTTGDYVIVCNATSSNAGNVTGLPANTSLHVNDPPIANWTYPSQGEWLHGTENLNASDSTDTDGTITNYLFELDNNTNFDSPSTLCNGADENCTFDTTTQTECEEESMECYLKLTVTDDDGAQNYTIIQIGIDNIPPTISNEQINDTSVGINEWICLNVTAQDSFNVSTVIAEIDIPGVASNENLTLFDNGTGCDSIADDDVYSRKYQSTQSGTYNWTKTYANDTMNNKNTSFPGVTWNVTTAASMIVNMTEPTADLEINESGYNNKYNQTCNVSCDSGGANCENVVLYTQYDPGTWTDITESTTDLINDEGNYSCGTVIVGTSCLHTFNITSGSNSGNNTWEIRCKAKSSNAPESYSTTVNLTVIDNSGPVSILDQPPTNGSITTDGFTVNASVTDSGVGVISWVMFEYRQNETTPWYSACNDTDGTAPFSCAWNLTGLPDLTTYEVRVRANDSLGNLGSYDMHTGITVDREEPQINLNSPKNDSHFKIENVTFNFTATDNLAVNLNCSLYIDSSLNQTNSSTINNTPTTFTVTNIAEGQHTWYINCSDDVLNLNVSETRNFTVDFTSPNWSNQNQTINNEYTDVVHRGDTIKLSAYWTDNIRLSKALLATNETGTWENKTSYGSPKSLTGTSAWSNFTWSNSSIALGTLVSWRIYANDTTGNTNYTGLISFRIWGWSEVSDSNLDPSEINQGQSTTMSCRVTDNVTSDPIENYIVYFYNSTSLLGINTTNASGWAAFTFTDNSGGDETITCNISDNATLYYNASSNNWAQETLNTQVMEQLLIYRITSDPCEAGTLCRDGIIIYNPNPNSTTITELKDQWSIDKISAITQCCTPNGCSLTYCSETPAGTVNFTGAPWTIQPYSYLVFWYEVDTPAAGDSVTLTANLTTQEHGTQTDDRTDVDIINKAGCAWTAWNDTNGFDTEATMPTTLKADAGSTTNFTLRLREFCDVSALQSGNNQVKISVPSEWSIGTIDSRCSASGNTITCNLTADLKNSSTDYSIELTAPNSTGKHVLQTNVTGTDKGGAVHEDVNEHVILVKDLSAPEWSNQNQTVNGNHTDLIHRGDSILLSAKWTDIIQLDYALLATNETGTWENKTSYGSPFELTGTSDWSNFTWSNLSINPGTLVGWRIYANDTTGNTNYTGLMSFRIWGWSNLTWISPIGGNYSGNKDIKLRCLVRDVNISTGIENYTVSFYRDTTLIGTNITNSTGYVVYNWNTSGLSTGNYELKCNITDNATLFYNKTAENEGSTIITVDSEYPKITLQSPLSGSYTADTSLNFSFIVTDDLAQNLNCSLYVDSILKDTNETAQNNTLTTITATSLAISSHLWNVSCKDSVLNQNWSETWNFTIYEGRTVNVTLINSTGITFENTTISIFDILEQEIGGKTITLFDAILSDELALNQNYDIETVTPLPGGSLTARIKNLNITGNLTIEPQVVENYSGTMPKIENVTALYALNDTGLSYNLTELYIPKNGLNISNIVHCINWSFTTANCSEWEVNSTEDYGMQENSTHIWFNVTDFTAFGGGPGSPLPNVTEIRIYDVTNAANPKTNTSNLVGNGTNTTFNFYQRGPRVYRVEIDVKNDASTQWTIAPEDDVYHEGLNSTWQINATADIWYHEGGTNYTGGNWSNGRVTWNTSLGGKLTKDETGTFYYVFNMTTSKTEEYPVYFLCNDTSSGSGSYDNSVYNITRIGYLEVNLTLPPQIPGQGDAENNSGYKVGQNKIFVINATVYCRDGYCGWVNGTLQYNQSLSLPDTPVNTTAGGKPFYVLDGINPKNCSTNPLDKDDFCSLSWQVNATGNLTSLWKLDVLFNSSLSEANETNYTKIEITLVLILSLTFTEVNFGVCNPVTYGNPASLNNETGYNISLNENSNDVDGVYIKGTDLEPQSVTGFGSINYSIGVGNLTWNDNENQYESTNTTRFTLDYDLIRSDISSGTDIPMYYWIDIPTGQYAQDYDGMLYIKVNTTEEY